MTDHPQIDTKETGPPRLFRGEREGQWAPPTPEHTTEYLLFFREPQDPKRKTATWAVNSRHHGDTLGYIRWYGRWRQYCFYPAANCIFNVGCMSDISDFITARMKERRT